MVLLVGGEIFYPEREGIQLFMSSTLSGRKGGVKRRRRGGTMTLKEESPIGAQ